MVLTGESDASVYLSAKHDVEIVRRLSLSENVLPSSVTVVRHAIREGPYLGVRPIFCQRECILQEVDLCLFAPVVH